MLQTGAVTRRKLLIKKLADVVSAELLTAVTTDCCAGLLTAGNGNTGLLTAGNGITDGCTVWLTAGISDCWCCNSSFLRCNSAA